MAGAATQSLVELRDEPRFRFRLASESDDPGLRELLRNTAMTGPVSVTFRREPDFFAATSLDGPQHQTLVVEDTTQGKIVATGSRSVRDRYVHGQVTPVGYLSGLRIHPDFRRGTLLARGYRELRRLHNEDRATDFYVTTIASENGPAFDALTGARARLPAYHPLGSYYTLVVPLSRLRPKDRETNLVVRPLRPDELPLLVSFLNDSGKSRSLFPRYDLQDFEGPHATLKNLQAHDILTAWDGTALVGCLGLWDQTDYKQIVVDHYSMLMRIVRPAFNAVATTAKWPQFPKPGRPFKSLLAAIPIIANDDPRIFRALLDSVGEHAKTRHPDFDNLMIGAYERDPILGVCARQSLFRYVTRVFAVYWDEPPVNFEQFEHENLYFELGCL